MTLMQILSFFIGPLHILCYYVLIFALDWKQLRQMRTGKIVRLFIAVFVLVTIQTLIKLFSPIPWLFILCINPVTILLLVVITYLSLARKDGNNLTWKIIVMLGTSAFLVIQILCAFLDKLLVVMCNDIRVIHPMIVVVILHNVIEAVLAFLVGFGFNYLYNIDRIIDKEVDNRVYRIALGMFLITFGLTLAYTLSEKLYDSISNLMIFMVIQLVLFWLLYFAINRQKKQTVHIKMIEDRLGDLKEYTDHLEVEQRKLRKFKHDYQNMVLSLEENLRESDSKEAKEYVETFKKYANKYIGENDVWKFNDFDNIKTPYLKSILINKMSQAEEQGIDVHFECRYDVEQIDMEPYDLVRIVGISYDNAIEAVQDLDKEHQKINVMVYCTEGQTEITIANPIMEKKNLDQLKQEGVTFKKGHSGFGLTNVEEISDHYDNVLVNYQETNGWFTIQFILMDQKSDK